MAADTPNRTKRVELDGVVYDAVEFTDLTVEDWELVYDEAKVAFSDYAPLDDPEQEAARIERLKSPRVEKAYFMIGYLRANPGATLDDARLIASKQKMVALLTATAEAVADEDAEDPTSATTPDAPSTSEIEGSSRDSSPDSPKSSETPDGELATTGTSG